MCGVRDMLCRPLPSMSCGHTCGRGGEWRRARACAAFGSAAPLWQRRAPAAPPQRAQRRRTSTRRGLPGGGGGRQAPGQRKRRLRRPLLPLALTRSSQHTAGQSTTRPSIACQRGATSLLPPPARPHVPLLHSPPPGRRRRGAAAAQRSARGIPPSTGFAWLGRCKARERKGKGST